MRAETFELSVTTQGPTYPPSEVMDADGNFIVIGRINRAAPDGSVRSEWGRAIVARDSALPEFGANLPYRIERELPANLGARDAALVLHTLPLPLPCNNYPMLFAPEQCPDAAAMHKPSYPFHQVPIPDLREQDGRKLQHEITLGQWVAARGQLRVSLTADERAANFEFGFTGLIPNSLYTVMSLRQHDLNPARPTRPGPLGVPNVFVTDSEGKASYSATLPDAFPDPDRHEANRIINVVVLWMSYQMNRGGAIGYFGLGGDIHAQLKLAAPSFQQFTTKR
ncbi:MAG: hypothetical protein H7Z39_12350 [Burkholderiaceae bacterium]|nr:hypothetical protein [Burkholderiaceae bacterium]